MGDPVKTQGAAELDRDPTGWFVESEERERGAAHSEGDSRLLYRRGLGVCPKRPGPSPRRTQNR